jgi:hypothetical protein
MSAMPNQNGPGRPILVSKSLVALVSPTQRPTESPIGGQVCETRDGCSSRRHRGCRSDEAGVSSWADSSLMGPRLAERRYAEALSSFQSMMGRLDGRTQTARKQWDLFRSLAGMVDVNERPISTKAEVRCRLRFHLCTGFISLRILS